MRVRRARAGAAAVLVATAVLAGFMWQRYATTGHSAVPLSAQQVRADMIERLWGPVAACTRSATRHRSS